MNTLPSPSANGGSDQQEGPPPFPPLLPPHDAEATASQAPSGDTPQPRPRRLSTPHVRKHRAGLRLQNIQRVETRLTTPIADLLRRLADYENQTLADYLAVVLTHHARRRRRNNPYV